MRKLSKLFTIALLFGAAISMSSCQKCTTCNYEDPSGSITWTNETCGNDADSDQNKADCQDLISNGGTCTCTTKFQM